MQAAIQKLLKDDLYARVVGCSSGINKQSPLANSKFRKAFIHLSDDKPCHAVNRLYEYQSAWKAQGEIPKFKIAVPARTEETVRQADGVQY